jgi:hypothetical protein
VNKSIEEGSGGSFITFSTDLAKTLFIDNPNAGTVTAKDTLGEIIFRIDGGSIFGRRGNTFQTGPTAVTKRTFGKNFPLA